jgi:dihydroorotase
MSKTIIKNTHIVNNNQTIVADIVFENGIITKIAPFISTENGHFHEINGEGKYLFPGVIDDQVHFREPGLTHKADIQSESRAAVAGGVTSFMEMPNTNPTSTTIDRLEDKYKIASQSSLANYSFFMGVTNDNADEVLKANPKNVCGIKIFMGSSTGDMLVENPQTLERIYCNAQMLIAIHSENDHVVKSNLEKAIAQYGENIPAEIHAEIRNVEACYKMTDYAVGIAKKCGTRLHVLHISTEEELAFFTNAVPMKDKKITAEVCVHHLWFDSSDYQTLGNLIKWNPAIKEARHKKALFEALLDDRLDIIATDHAPHTWDEKQQMYLKAPSGGPLVQHSLNVMLEFYHQKKISLEKIVDKMCHKPAQLFDVHKRGFLNEGYFADAVLVDIDQPWQVNKSNILYKCGWSAFEGYHFKSKIEKTFINGYIAYDQGVLNTAKNGMRLTFDR